LEKLGSIAAVIDDRVKALMNVWNMKALKVILAIKCPMRVDRIFPNRRQLQARFDISKPYCCTVPEFIKRCDGVDRGKNKIAVLLALQFAQIIALRGKVYNAFKLRHGQELSVE
jgi:hypothetical protein